MTIKTLTSGLIALALVASTGAVHAQKKSEPTTLKSIGKNIGHTATRLGKNIGKESTRTYKSAEYGVRKGGENTSVTVHRALGNNSKVRNRGEKKTEVVTPNGKHFPVKKS